MTPPTLSSMVDRLERLTDLVLVLLRDQRPKSLREIASEVPGYPVQEGEARRQAFERDKRTLRDGGIEVTAMPIDAPEPVGYVIRPEDYYLPDLDLAPDEQAALNLAVHAVDPEGARCGTVEVVADQVPPPTVEAELGGFHPTPVTAVVEAHGCPRSERAVQRRKSRQRGELRHRARPGGGG